MTETILLTGATGLVGTHFLYRFKKWKIKPYVTAVYYNEIPKHLKELSNEQWVYFVKADLTTYDIAMFASYDTIIHAATYGQPGKFMAQPTGTLKLNTMVTQYLLERCLNEGGKFLFISTSEVYSGLTQAPYTEDRIGTTTPYHPRAGYIEGKRCGEAIVNTFRNEGVDAKSVRLSLAYGDGTKKNDERALNQFIQMGIEEGVIKLRDKGTSLRTYCYVEDACNMMGNILYNGQDVLYNVGGESKVTIAELAWSIAYILDVKVELGDEGDDTAPQDTSMSIYKYQQEFGKYNFIQLSDGLQRTIKYQKQLYGT